MGNEAATFEQIGHHFEWSRFVMGKAMQRAERFSSGGQQA